jgi:hypothetical protein
MSDHFSKFLNTRLEEMPEPGTRPFAYEYELQYRKKPGDITYVINQYGYRGNILPGGDAAFGCSYTFGFYLDEGLSWPSLMGIFNGAVCAVSNDTIARNAVSYIRNYKPKNVYVMWTFESRREIVSKSGTYLKFGPTMQKNPDVTSEFYGQLLLYNKHSDQYNMEKNQLLLESVAHTHGTHLHQLHVDDFRPEDYPPLALNDAHPGEAWHQAVANYFDK